MARINLINLPKASRFSISMETVRNVLNSLHLLTTSNQYQGINQFISNTYAKLDHKIRRNNEIIMCGLHYAAYPEKDFSSFQEYIDDLKTEDPYFFQERLFHAYDRISSYKVNIISDKPVTITKADQKRILSKKEFFFEYLNRCFTADSLDYSIEEEAYKHLIKPDKMKDFIVSHFQYMWDNYLKNEFTKNYSTLENAVNEFNNINFDKLSAFQIVNRVTGHNIEVDWADKKWELEWVEKSKKVIFVPSIHMGPFIGRSLRSDSIYIFFTPRTTEAISFNSPDLTRTDISVRLNTLSDDTRLKILKIIGKEHELSSKQIMDTLDLCQSAASRHLKQLSATGYLNERRQNSAKIYSLNTKFITKTFDAVSDYLLKD